MCDFHQHDLAPLDEDEYALDTPRVRGFVSDVRACIECADSPVRACELISPLFAGLLADRDWLPSAFQEPAADSGMGGGIGQWLAFRAGGRSLALFSLVVPPGAMTPVHDHLAWGPRTAPRAGFEPAAYSLGGRCGAERTGYAGRPRATESLQTSEVSFMRCPVGFRTIL